MLQEAMTKVQEAERQAEEIVQEAKEKGTRLIEEARAQAKLLLEQAKENAMTEARARLDQVKSAVATQKEEYASSLGEEMQQTTKEVEKRKADAVNAIVEALL